LVCESNVILIFVVVRSSKALCQLKNYKYKCINFPRVKELVGRHHLRDEGLGRIFVLLNQICEV
jgi:hypothetical protein